jgi:hypothetical protein
MRRGDRSLKADSPDELGHIEVVAPLSASKDGQNKIKRSKI